MFLPKNGQERGTDAERKTLHPTTRMIPPPDNTRATDDRTCSNAISPSLLQVLAARLSAEQYAPLSASSPLAAASASNPCLWMGDGLVGANMFNHPGIPYPKNNPLNSEPSCCATRNYFILKRLFFKFFKTNYRKKTLKGYPGRSSG